MRHPSDAGGWKHFDFEFSEFALDPQNVRLGLASDGFNPFKYMSIAYNILLAFFNIMVDFALKQYVQNKACPEGSIAKAYIMNELSTFYSRYLSGIETRFSRVE